jgi:site-specific recombinase XerD
MSNRKPSAYSIPPAGKISALRQRMIDDMTVRNLAPNTMLCYLKQVHYLARYFPKSPEQLSREDIREYQLYLAKDRKVSVNSRLVATTALRFLYGVTLQRDRFIEMLPMPRKEHRLPVILSPAEVLRFLGAAPSFTHRVIFSIMYGTGMRVSEAVHLQMRHVDSQRRMIRIEQSKGKTGIVTYHSPPNCWNCCAPIGARFGHGSGFSQDRIRSNRWAERLSAKP